LLFDCVQFHKLTVSAFQFRRSISSVSSAPVPISVTLSPVSPSTSSMKVCASLGSFENSLTPAEFGKMMSNLVIATCVDGESRCQARTPTEKGSTVELARNEPPGDFPLAHRDSPLPPGHTPVL